MKIDIQKYLVRKLKKEWIEGIKKLEQSLGEVNTSRPDYSFETWLRTHNLLEDQPDL